MVQGTVAPQLPKFAQLAPSSSEVIDIATPTEAPSPASAPASPAPPPPAAPASPRAAPAPDVSTRPVEDPTNTHQAADRSTIEELSEDLNFPSANRLFWAMRRKGVRVLRENVQKVVKRQEFRRSFLRKIPPKGLRGPNKDHKPKAGVVSWEADRRWDADLISYPASEASKGFRYILIVQDVHSRALMTEPLTDSRGEPVARALAELIRTHGAPAILVTDGGPEFNNANVKAVCARNNIERRFQEPGDYSTTATLSTAIKSLKHALALRVAGASQKEWADHLQDATHGENTAPRSHLLGQNAEEVYADGKAVQHGLQPKDKDRYFSREKENAETQQLVSDNIDKREADLREKGGFREIDTNTANHAFRRGHKPMWMPDVRGIAEVTGNFVKDTRGRSFQARRILPTFTAAAHDRKDGAEEANVERHRDVIEAFLQNKERAPLSTLAAHLRREGVVLGVRLVRALQILDIPYWTVGATTYAKAR